ncbi:MAG TPA: hypothetical protein VI387_05770, partial [Candidatus Brocadiales bacterium]|nr:hypothetical protein [Candidatus Brocadiales bacterium]
MYKKVRPLEAAAAGHEIKPEWVADWEQEAKQDITYGRGHTYLNNLIRSVANTPGEILGGSEAMGGMTNMGLELGNWIVGKIQYNKLGIEEKFMIDAMYSTPDGIRYLYDDWRDKQPPERRALLPVSAEILKQRDAAEDKLKKNIGTIWTETINTIFPDNPLLQHEFANKVIGSVGMAIPYVAAAAISGGGTVIPSVVGGAMFGLQNGFGQYTRAIESGAREDQAYQALLMGTASGSIGGVVMGRLLGRLNKLSTGKLASTILPGLQMSPTWHAAMHGGETAIQLMMIHIFNNFTAKQLYDEGQKIIDSGVLESGAIGLVLGAIIFTVKYHATKGPTKIIPGSVNAERWEQFWEAYAKRARKADKPKAIEAGKEAEAKEEVVKAPSPEAPPTEADFIPGFAEKPPVEAPKKLKTPLAEEDFIPRPITAPEPEVPLPVDYTVKKEPPVKTKTVFPSEFIPSTPAHPRQYRKPKEELEVPGDEQKEGGLKDLESAIGAPVDYQGIKGTLEKDEEGNYIVRTNDRSVHLVEGSLSGKTPAELGLEPSEADPVEAANKVPAEEITEDKILFDGVQNKVYLYGNSYEYDGVEVDKKGNETAIRVKDEKGKIKFIRNAEARDELLLQKLIYEESFEGVAKKDIDEAEKTIKVTEVAPAEVKGEVEAVPVEPVEEVKVEAEKVEPTEAKIEAIEPEKAEKVEPEKPIVEPKPKEDAITERIEPEGDQPEHKRAEGVG